MFLKVSLIVLLLNLSKPALIAAQNIDDEFNEEVLVRSLPTGDVLASFSFTIRSPTPSEGPRKHFDLLPKFVGEVMDENGVYELDVAPSRGVWRSRFWGYPPRPTAAGARVAAFFKPGD
jgi:phosphatidylinositol glycan class T